MALTLSRMPSQDGTRSPGHTPVKAEQLKFKQIKDPANRLEKRKAARDHHGALENPLAAKKAKPGFRVPRLDFAKFQTALPTDVKNACSFGDS